MKYSDTMQTNTYKASVVPIEMEYNGKTYKGEGRPLTNTCIEGVCFELDITLNNEHLGIIRCESDGWKMSSIADQSFVNAIGQEISLWYE